MTLPNGIITAYDYDPLQRLTKLTHYLPDATPEDLSDNQPLLEFDYDLGADGQRLGVTEKRWDDGVLVSHTKTDWTYDSLNRLTDEVFTDVGDLLAGLDDYHAEYIYGLTGNRLQKLVDDGSDGIIDESIFYLYDANDRLIREDGAMMAGQPTTITYSYGGAGNPLTQLTGKQQVIQATSEVLEQTTLSYDLAGRIASVTSRREENGQPIEISATYTYDHLGNRIRREQTVRIDDGPGTVNAIDYLVDSFHWTGLSQVIEERDAVSGLPAHTFTVGHRVVMQTDAVPDAQPLLLLTDGRNSTRAVVDSAQNVLATYDYDAYGLPFGFAISADPEKATLVDRLFTGEQYDSVLQLQYNRARYYDGTTGRFTSPDPYAGSGRKPITLHRYVYAGNDPIALADPTGRIFVAFDGTWNYEIEKDDNYLTNVRKMFLLTDESESPRYLRGVGNSLDNPSIVTGTIAGLIAGVTGFGAAEYLQQGLEHVATRLASGDQPSVDVIGFSRGAATAIEFAHRVQEEFPQVRIRFMGLWDTVASFGIPGNGLNCGYRMTLAGNVQSAYQAIAFHEIREVFPATNIRSSRIHQEAFKGQHGDIGGGWPPGAESGLSNITLAWMIENARRHGVSVAVPTALPTDAGMAAHVGPIMPYMLSGPLAFNPGGLNRSTIEHNQWFPLGLSWYADEIDFTRVGYSRAEANGHMVMYPAFRIVELGYESLVTVAPFTVTPSWPVITSLPVGTALAVGHFAVGVFQLHHAEIQYFLNRI